MCWICYSDQGQFGFFLGKASHISQLFSGAGKLEMRDKEAYVGKQNLGPCTVISYLMIFSYNLVHATGVN